MADRQHSEVGTMSPDRKSWQHGFPVAIEGTGSLTIQATRNIVRLGNSVAT